MPYKKQKQAFFDDIKVGESIPSLVKGPYTVMDLAQFGAMIGDFYPAHYDYKWATEKSRAPSVVVYGLKLATDLSQLLSDFAGRHGAVNRYSNRVTAQTYIGETLTMKGKVTGKFRRHGEGFVELDIWGEKEGGATAVIGKATVILPDRIKLRGKKHGKENMA